MYIILTLHIYWFSCYSIIIYLSGIWISFQKVIILFLWILFKYLYRISTTFLGFLIISVVVIIIHMFHHQISFKWIKILLAFIIGYKTIIMWYCLRFILLHLFFVLWIIIWILNLQLYVLFFWTIDKLLFAKTCIKKILKCRTLFFVLFLLYLYFLFFLIIS